MIEATVTAQADKPIEFPCLMKGKPNDIVLFTDYKKGTVIFSESALHTIGDYNENWSMGLFEPLSPNDSVTLKNVSK